MSKDTQTTTYLHRIERLRHSVNGNPRARFHTSDGVFTSSSDAAFMYGVENDRPVGKRVTLTLTRAGRVRDLKLVNPGQES